MILVLDNLSTILKSNVVEDRYYNAHSNTSESISLPTTACLDFRADYIHSSPAVRRISSLFDLDH
jgi:hypothetical protein